MAIKINVSVAPIEFEINGKEYQAKRSDTLLRKLDGYYKAVQTELSQVDEENATVEDLDTTRQKVIEGIDLLLGEDAFKDIEHSLANDDEEYTIAMGQIFFQVFAGYRTQMEATMSNYDREE